MRCCVMSVLRVFFFFQAEDGIRDGRVTGVQTCSLPIWALWTSTTPRNRRVMAAGTQGYEPPPLQGRKLGPRADAVQIGRAACRGRGESSGGGGVFKKKKKRGGKRARGAQTRRRREKVRT